MASASLTSLGSLGSLTCCLDIVPRHMLEQELHPEPRKWDSDTVSWSPSSVAAAGAWSHGVDVVG